MISEGGCRLYAFCENCGYDSGEARTMKELKQKVEVHGGNFEKNICPECRKQGRMEVKENYKR